MREHTQNLEKGFTDTSAVTYGFRKEVEGLVTFRIYEYSSLFVQLGCK